MKVRTHIYSSAILGGTIYALTTSKSIAISALVGGVFIDLDHIFDFFIFSGERFSIKNLFSWCDGLRWEKLTLLLHSWEIFLGLVVLAFFYPNHILIGSLLGGGLHLILDQIGNPYRALQRKLIPSPLFYFLTYRCFVGFHKDRLLVRLQHQGKKDLP